VRHPLPADAGHVPPENERAGVAHGARDRGPADAVQMIGMGYFPDEVGLARPPDETGR